METTATTANTNNAPVMKSAKETTKYFWDNELYDIAVDLDREKPSDEVLSLDKDVVIKRFANALKFHYPPRTNQDNARTLFYACELEDAVNDFGFNYEAFAEYVVTNYHRTLQQSTMRLIMHIIKAFAKVKYTDARNEDAVLLAKKLDETLEKIGYSLPMI